MTYKALRKASRKVAQAAHVAVLCGATAFSPVAFALQVQIGQRVQSYGYDAHTQVVNQAGVLPAGSVVDIPDQYRVTNDGGETDVELTLNNWLRKSGYKPTATGDSASDSNDYFFPVKILSGNNSLKNSIQYISIRKLARNGKLLALSEGADPLNYPSDIDDMPLQTADNSDPNPHDKPADDGDDAPPPSRHRRHQQEDPDHEYTTACPDGSCYRDDANPSPAVASLARSLSTQLKAVTSKANEIGRDARSNLPVIEDRFKHSCGLSLDQFAGELKNILDGTDIPPAIMMSLMVQESGGNCDASSRRVVKTRHGKRVIYDRGLFQATSDNMRTYHVSLCTSAQRREIESTHTVSGMKSGPQCLSNPLVAAKLAKKIFQNQLDWLERGAFSNVNFDKSAATKATEFRLAVSAYNGGPGWVVKAKRDMEAFNSEHGTHLSPANWEDLRLFYFRGQLNRNGHSSDFAYSTGSNRSNKNVILNLGYTEDVIPRERGSRPAGSSQTLVEYFSQKFEDAWD